MDIQVYDRVNNTLADSFTKIEQSQNVLIDSEIRLFISRFVFESLFFRREEWQGLGMDPDKAESTGKISGLVFDSVTKIFTTQATGGLIMDRKRLLLIDVVQKIQEDWCRIFPFCR